MSNTWLACSNSTEQHVRGDLLWFATACSAERSLDRGKISPHLWLVRADQHKALAQGSRNLARNKNICGMITRDPLILLNSVWGEQRETWKGKTSRFYSPLAVNIILKIEFLSQNNIKTQPVSAGMINLPSLNKWEEKHNAHSVHVSFTDTCSQAN